MIYPLVRELAADGIPGDVAGCVLRSDRGPQFRSRRLQQALLRHRMLGSMGRVGSAGDNAAMESFFSPLQKTSSTVGVPQADGHRR